MDGVDLLWVVAVFLAVVTTAHIWGPLVLVLVLVAAGWLLYPTGRHRTVRLPLRTSVRTRVRVGVRDGVDTDPDTVVIPIVTCTDTGPDVSAKSRPAVSGHEEEGER
ncbi:hypothetical protein ACGFR8_07620 [Streptomyces brevispora]|uniref:hypothetical protein n=1 Tax=Streptomyces brevispora TaxID=887462 RepID=UPI0037115B92